MPSSLRVVLQGALVGLANAIPGLSGGTLLLMLGIFRKTLDAIKGLLRFDAKWFSRFLFLCLLGVGLILGVISTAKLVDWWMQVHMASLMALFFGLVLASVPALYKRYRSWQGSIALIAGAVFVIAIAQIPQVQAPEHWSFLILVGAIASVAMLLPGLSGSLMLLSLGVYPLVIRAVSELNMSVLFPLACGVGLGLILGAWAIRALLDAYPRMMGGLILGLMLGGLWILFPVRYMGGGFAAGGDFFMTVVELLLVLACTVAGVAAWGAVKKLADKS